MSILVDRETKLLVQGITGRQGQFHTRLMVEYGTQVVGGVTPGKGGEWVDTSAGKLPVFDTVKEAVEATGANCSIVLVPAPFAPDAIFEAADANIPLVVCTTEHIPVQDMMSVREYLDQKGTLLIGPNCPGVLTPEQAKVGFIPGHSAKPGNVGIISRSGTLTYEVMYALTQKGMGQSTCVGIGGDPIKGLNYTEVLQMFEDDPGTAAIVMIGEIGGTDEEKAAEYIAEKVTKPVVSFIAGRSAPPGKRMGHAGAIVEGGTGSAEDKIAALESVGVRVADHPEQIADLLADMDI